MNNKKGFILALILADLLIVVGCEKSLSPFSSNPSQPSQSTAKIYVVDGSNAAANVVIKGIDPTGNVFTTISDSYGFAVFNPLPFNPGKWTFQMPNQNNRCFGNDTESVSILSDVTSQAATFQYGVFTNINFSSPSISSTNPITVSQSVSLNNQNDCGISWACSINLNGTNFVWSFGGSGWLSPGNTYSVSLISGQSTSFTLVEFIPGANISSLILTLRSIFGETNAGSATF